jgi:integrase
MNKLPRYVQKQKFSNGSIFYRFNPPQKYVDGGVVKRVNLGNSLSEARQQASKFNALIDKFSHESKKVISISTLPTFFGLVHEYKKSNDFNNLSDKSRKDYVYFLDKAMETTYQSKNLSDIKLKNISGGMARQLYEVWLNRGISMANHICAVIRKVYSFGIEMGYVEVNPFKSFKLKATQKRNTVWSREEMLVFLNKCYSKFEYRNIGLIAQMAYEWCQRIGDMRTLEFDNIDFNKGVLKLQQSKRRAVVTLPISDDLLDMLKNQKQDFGFQKYVAPNPKPKGGVYKPYTVHTVSILAKNIMKSIGLPDNLWLMDFRRTGTTEMVEAGVSMGQIMSVTGHVNPNSVKPYMKHTYTSADNALTKRKKYVNNNIL